MQPEHIAAWIRYNKSCVLMDYFLIIAFSVCADKRQTDFRGLSVILLNAIVS